MRDIRKLMATGAAALMCLSLTVAVSVGFTSPARGTDPPPNPVTANLSPGEEAQISSLAWAVSHQIHALADLRDHDNGARGFAFVQSDIPTNRVDLWWKGRVDDDIASILAMAEGQGVTVAVHQVPRTLLTMMKLGSRIGPALRKEGLDLIAGRPVHDMSGFHLALARQPEADNSPMGRERRADKANEASRAATGVPVAQVEEWKGRPRDLVGRYPVRPGTIHTSDPCSPTRPFCRQNDKAPYSGGAIIRNNDIRLVIPFGSYYEFCTTGFSVEMNQPPSPTPPVTDVARMLTAAHCDSSPLTPSSDYDNGQDVNYTTANGIPHPNTQFKHMDAMVLNPDPPGATTGTMFGGASWSDYKADVVGPQSNGVGDEIRISGANTGQRDALFVRSINWFWASGGDAPPGADPDFYAADGCYAGRPNSDAPCYYGVLAMQQGVNFPDNCCNATNVVATGGDSGGPIYNPTGVAGKVYARGIIKGGHTDYEVNCNQTTINFGVPGSEQGTCYTAVFFMPIVTMDSTWGNKWDLMPPPP